ncbi:protein twisted gastrulation [Hermetia illucens]|nr:protein twisted gastrulation [Hermetia illucens]
MGGMKFLCVLALSAFGVLLIASYADSCNEYVCASIVSKCLLTQSCKCDLKNCTCCKDCFSCLSNLYSECCSCLDLCPKPNDTKTPKKSHLDEFEGIPGLFDALAGEADEDKWTTFTFPVDFDSLLTGSKVEKDIKYYLHSNEQNVDVALKEREDIVTYNCTVVYINQCLSWNKCRQNCQSMGASSCRWFHDGCCECVGSKCINYGINESRCSACPEEDDILDDIPIDDLDYGDEMGPYDGTIDNTNF